MSASREPKPFVSLRWRKIVLHRDRHIPISMLVSMGIGSRAEIRAAMQPGSFDLRLRCALRTAQSGGWWMRHGVVYPGAPFPRQEHYLRPFADSEFLGIRARFSQVAAECELPPEFLPNVLTGIRQLLRERETKEGAITPLNDEFPELYGHRKIGQRLARAIFPSESPMEDHRRFTGWVLRHIQYLRETPLLPSRILDEASSAVGCAGVPAEQRPSIRIHSQMLSAVARDLGIDRHYIYSWWSFEAKDLDAQWRVLRSELAAIRAEPEATR